MQPPQPPPHPEADRKAPPPPQPAHRRTFSTVSAPDNGGMVPITREYLREFYKQFPNPSFAAATAAARRKMMAAGKTIRQSPKPIEPIPNRMDEGMFAARCACEEAIEALKPITHSDVQRACVALQATADRFAKFQDKQRAHASAVVASFLPQDFRGQLFQQVRARSEAKNKAEVEELVRSGASVSEKFELLWKQQWARRETLGAVGNATGIWKALVKFIAGVPEPLLDFAKQINVPNGPTEELRIKFAPVFGRLIEMSRELARLAEALAAGVVQKEERVALGVLADAAVELRKETERFCELLEIVVESSPFFVSQDQIEEIGASK